MIRWSTIALIIGALVAGVAYDRVAIAPLAPAAPSEAATIAPELVSPPRLTSDWYCPIGSSVDDGYAEHKVIVSNIGQDKAVVTLDTLTSDGPGPGLRFELEAMATEEVDLRSLVQADAIGAVVEVHGGEGVVGHEVQTAQGVAQGPCSTSAADSWYFASGATTRDSREYLAVLNPSLDDVVFSAEFEISGRQRDPGELRKVGVAPQSVLVIDLGEFVAREELIGTSIVAERGLLVVERLIVRDGTLGPVGAALELGVSDPAELWVFPAGRLSSNADNTVSVFNPNDEPAEVEVVLDPLNNSDRASYGLAPIELSIAPGRTAQVDLAELSEAIGIALPYELGIRVQSVNGIGVVAERWQLMPGIDRSLIGAGGVNARKVNDEAQNANDAVSRQDGDETEVPFVEEPLVNNEEFLQATASSGVVTSRGTEQASTRWVIPWVSLVPDGGTVLVISGTEAKEARVQAQVMVGGSLLPPARTIVAPGGRSILAPGSPVAAAPIIITSDQPVWVEAQIVGPDGRISVVAAVPTRAN